PVGGLGDDPVLLRHLRPRVVVVGPVQHIAPPLQTEIALHGPRVEASTAVYVDDRELPRPEVTEEVGPHRQGDQPWRAEPWVRGAVTRRDVRQPYLDLGVDVD